MEAMSRILTTHTGSLPRPDDLAQMIFDRDDGKTVEGIDERVRRAVRDVVAEQAHVGVDLLNDGEEGKIGYSTYVKDRLTGFDGEAERPGSRRPEMEEHPDFAQRWATQIGSVRLRAPACTGEIRLKDPEAVHRDIDNLKAAAKEAGVDQSRLFLSAASPGVVSHFFANHHYPNREAFLAAIADAMRDEYRAIVDAGITLQLDCPDLAMSRHVSVRRQHAGGVPARDRTRRRGTQSRRRRPRPGAAPDAHLLGQLRGTSHPRRRVEGHHRHRPQGEAGRDLGRGVQPSPRARVAGLRERQAARGQVPDPGRGRLHQQLRRASGRGRSAAAPIRGGGRSGARDRRLRLRFGTFTGMSTVAPSITWAKLRTLAEGARRASAKLEVG